MIYIHANPFGKTEKKIGFIATAYVYPYFDQFWNLFAPAPHTNYKLLLHYNINESHYTDLVQELHYKHRENLLAGYEPMLLALTASIHFFEKSAESKKGINKIEPNDKYFSIVKHSAKKYLENVYGKDVELQNICLVVEDIESKERRVFVE